jgi:hypothetical protein
MWRKSSESGCRKSRRIPHREACAASAGENDERSGPSISREDRLTRTVSESGIQKRDDVLRLSEAGVHAMLVGEALLQADDPGAKARELLGDRQ